MKIYFHIVCLLTNLSLGGLLGGGIAKAQSSGYTLVGFASQNSSSDCYQITDNRPLLYGAMWNNKLLRLTESFEIEYKINFGNNPYDADGIVMAMQSIGTTALGSSGNGMAYAGLFPSLGIEFDTFQNQELGDLPADHIALLRDGNPDHTAPPNSIFSPPVPISIKSNDITDGLDHVVKIKWNAASQLFQVEVDCVTRISQRVDLINSIFKGVKDVYFGFTSSNSILGGIHTVCIDKDVVVRNTLQACQMEKLTLVAGLSKNNQYDWKPATGLSNSRIRNPQLTATTSQLYTVTYVDYCSRSRTDSVYVDVKTPTIELGKDRKVCENEAVELTPTLTPANRVVHFNWSTGDTTRQLKPTTSGLYSLRITVDNCSANDSVRVTFFSPPKTTLSGEPVYDCPRDQPILLNPRITGTNLQFMWAPTNTSDSTLLISTPGMYSVKVTKDSACAVEQTFRILNNCSALLFIPDAFTPNGDRVNDTFEWKSDMDVEAQMKIYNRWGEIVFASENTNEFWNGTWLGRQCPATIYTWRLDYRPLQNKTNSWFIKRGTVLLIR